MVAEEIMTDDVVTLSETATLGEALQIMQERDIRHVPVLRANGELVGMLSDRDLRSVGAALVSDIESLDRMRARLGAPVSSLMSADIVSIERETSLADIIETLLEEKLSALPVVDEETSELVGIVSYVDVLRAVAEQVE
ncbi:MAG: CBS domain-containing protein [Sandaracinaceae bacterium]|nr:CBS domain-containing protein [Sandaracinaceae bacterium]MCC6873312.1 CBS domain-containing protein [Sandaracinaceae bacterium]